MLIKHKEFNLYTNHDTFHNFEKDTNANYRHYWPSLRSDAELQPNPQSTRASEVKNRLVGILNVL